MTFRMIAQLWNTNTPAIVSCAADLTENYMYISLKFRTGVHVFCWEVGAFNRSCFQSVSCNRREGLSMNFDILVKGKSLHRRKLIYSFEFNKCFF